MAMISPELLRRYPHFATVQEESLQRVAMIGVEKQFEPGDILFKEGDPADLLFVVEEGEVGLQAVLGSGDRKPVDTLVGGDIMCTSALVEPYELRFEGIARKPTKVIAIQAEKLRELFETDTEMGYRLMCRIAEAMLRRLEGARHQLAALS